MSQVGRFKEFVNRNIVAIVMVPSIIALHWGWQKLQDVEALIKPEDRKQLPIIEGAKYVEGKIEESIESWKNKSSGK